MRLRRETTKNKYEFALVYDSEEAIVEDQSISRLTIEKGLGVEDLVGALIVTKTTVPTPTGTKTVASIVAIIAVSEGTPTDFVNSNYLTLTASSGVSQSNVYVYNRITGLLVPNSEFDPEHD